MSAKVPKRFAVPANGLSLEDEPADLKAARVMAFFRWMAEPGTKGRDCYGFHVDGVPFMLIRFRPQPDGPHIPDSDLSGAEI